MSASIMLHGAFGVWDEIIAGVLVPLLATLVLHYSWRLSKRNSQVDE